jgi:hypothetical protein
VGYVVPLSVISVKVGAHVVCKLGYSAHEDARHRFRVVFGAPMRVLKWTKGCL